MSHTVAVPAGGDVDLNQVARIGHQHVVEPPHHVLGLHLGTLHHRLAELLHIRLYLGISQQARTLRSRRCSAVACRNGRLRSVEGQGHILPCKGPVPVLRRDVLFLRCRSILGLGGLRGLAGRLLLHPAKADRLGTWFNDRQRKGPCGHQGPMPRQRRQRFPTGTLMIPPQTMLQLTSINQRKPCKENFPRTKIQELVSAYNSCAPGCSGV